MKDRFGGNAKRFISHLPEDSSSGTAIRRRVFQSDDLGAEEWSSFGGDERRGFEPSSPV
jgi:hypothetical protein